MTKNVKQQGSPSRLIDARIRELNDWRGETLARIRRIIKHAVKMTFAKGASLEDPSGLFNASLDGNTRRAIDIHEGEEIDDAALTASSAPQWRSIPPHDAANDRHFVGNRRGEPG